MRIIIKIIENIAGFFAVFLCIGISKFQKFQIHSALIQEGSRGWFRPFECSSFSLFFSIFINFNFNLLFIFHSLPLPLISWFCFWHTVKESCATGDEQQARHDVLQVPAPERRMARKIRSMEATIAWIWKALPSTTEHPYALTLFPSIRTSLLSSPIWQDESVEAFQFRNFAAMTRVSMSHPSRELAVSIVSHMPSNPKNFRAHKLANAPVHSW